MSKEFEALFNKAWAAGREAGTKLVPTPMAVQFANSLTSTFDWNAPYEVIDDGYCGFGWVNIYKASPAGRSDSPFVKWLRSMAAKTGDRRYGRYASYEKAWQIWISDYSQSGQRKESHANAMAAVLREAGITAYGGGRMD